MFFIACIQGLGYNKETCPIEWSLLLILLETGTLLILANTVRPKIVSEGLGHANIGITLDRYSQVTAQMQQEAAAQLEALLQDAI